MALNPTEILQSLLVLGLTARTDVTFYYFGEAKKLRDAEICRKALGLVNAEQEAKVREILVQYATVEYDTDTLKIEGLNSNPRRLRMLCMYKMADTIGYAPSSMGSLQSRRG